MLMLSDLTTMALFAEVVDLRSFTAAAVTAGMAKATVSRRIAQLERRLGVRLLQRTTRRVIPTEEGRRLYDRCVQIVAAGKQASELLLDAGTRPSGVLRVGAPIAFTHLHLTPVVVKFLERNPEIELQLLPRSSPNDLVADEIDVAIRVGQPADPSLVVRRLATDAIVAVGAPAYLRRHGTPRSLAELQSHTCLRFSWEAERPSWRYRRSSCRSGPPQHGSLRLQACTRSPPFALRSRSQPGPPPAASGWKRKRTAPTGRSPCPAAPLPAGRSRWRCWWPSRLRWAAISSGAAGRRSATARRRRT